MNNSLRNFARAFITPVKEEKSKKIFFRDLHSTRNPKICRTKKIEFHCHITL